MIHIEYDNEIVDKKGITVLSNAIQSIVAEVTNVEDVFVYGNSAEIKVKIAPIEIFIRMSSNKISNPDELIAQIKERLMLWKKESSFSHLINLTLIPMNWEVAIGI